MEANILNTNKGIKSFFENNWLSLLLIVGVAIAFYFGIQRLNALNEQNQELNGLLADQRASIEENHDTIDTLNEAVVAEREAREVLKREYETQIEEVRVSLQRQIDDIRRRRIVRTNELTNNPSTLVDSYNSTFGFGRTGTP